MEVKIINYDGITLKTKNKYVTDDISVEVDESLIPKGTLDITENGEHDVTSYEKVNVNIESSGGNVDVLDSVAYYKATRNKNYPYFPLPSEMQEEQDTIYMLYDASGYMCCPAFLVRFDSCVCTVQKYMNTTLVSEYVDTDIPNNAKKYMQFSEEDSDYNTYNYIVIKLQGAEIRYHYLDIMPQFNGITYNKNAISELIEVSGKCNRCYLKVCSNYSIKLHKRLEYYSFDNHEVVNGYYMFYQCYSLKAIPQLDLIYDTDIRNMFSDCHSLKAIPLFNTSKVNSMGGMFSSCHSLDTIPQLDTSKVTNIESMFSNCYNLKTIPPLDTSSATNMNYMFNSCYSLDTIPQLDTSNATSMSYIFGNACKLVKLNITNMKLSFDISNQTMLSKNELIKILNNLLEVTTTQTLTLGSTNLDKLTDEEKAIATNKGWTLA